METLLIVLVVLISVAVLLLVAAFVGLAIALSRIGRLADTMIELVRATLHEIVPIAAEARVTLSRVTDLTGRLSETTERFNRVAEEAERLLDAIALAEYAGRAVKSSATGIMSVYEGFRQGIKTLLGSKETAKGGSEDEQR